jgi:hypothetical protein
LFKWIKEFFLRERRSFIKKRLKLLNKYQKLLYNKGDPTLKKQIKKSLKDFNNIYLKYDGVFIIKLMSKLTSDVVGTSILLELWKQRKVNKKNEEKTKPKEPFIEIIRKSGDRRDENLTSDNGLKNEIITEESENDYELESQSDVNSTINSITDFHSKMGFDNSNIQSTSLIHHNENLINRNLKHKKVDFNLTFTKTIVDNQPTSLNIIYNQDQNDKNNDD